MYLLNGYLGYGNYGDELLADLVSRKILEKYKFSKEKPEIKRLSSLNNLMEHFKLIKNCEEMICIGGIFQDSTSRITPLYYFLCTFVAKFLGKKVRYLAQGIGPLNHSRSQWLTKLAFGMADSVSVRDRSSSISLGDWGIDHYHGSDLAWTLYRDKNFKEEFLQTQINEEKIASMENLFSGTSKFLVLSLRAPRGHYDVNAYAQKLSERISVEAGQRPILILEMQARDSALCELIREQLKTKVVYLCAKDYSPHELIYLFENYCEAMLGMRLHGLILGHIAGLSITAIPVDPKINEFMHQVDIYNLETLRERAERHYEKVLLSF